MSAHFARAQQLMQLGRFDQAAEQLQMNLAENPNDPYTHAMLGICFSELDRRDDALAACREAIGLGPDDEFTHHAYAGVLNDQNQLEEAEAAAREAVALNPGNVANHRLLATVLLNRQRWSEALASAEQGLSIDSEDVDCLNTRAVALTQLGRRDEAGEAIESALRRDPDNADSHANLGWTKLHGGRHREALEHFREALRLEPDHDRARHGILEAMKARNPIYRWLLRYFLWMSRFSPGVMMGLIIGMVVAINLLSRLGPQSGPGAVAIEWVVYGYLGFVFLTWLGNDLFNLLLRLDRFGRMVLSDEERRDSTLLGLSILLLGGMALYSLVTEGIGLIFFVPILAVAGALGARGHLKLIFGLVACALILSAMGLFTLIHFPQLLIDPAALKADPPGPEARRYQDLAILLTRVTVWGSVAMTWIVSTTSMKRS